MWGAWIMNLEMVGEEEGSPKSASSIVSSISSSAVSNPGGGQSVSSASSSQGGTWTADTFVYIDEFNMQFTIHNDSGSNGQVTSIAVIGDLLSSTPALPFTVNDGASQVVSVTSDNDLRGTYFSFLVDGLTTYGDFGPLPNGP